jgi:biopolymer transport protein ExbD
MMDILTVLLLFLLKSFVVDGSAMTPVPGVDLPESSSEATPRSAIVIAIFDDAVMLNGESVASVSEAVASDDLLIESLADRLGEARETATEIAKRRGNVEEFIGTVSIQGDRKIEFAILQRVMYTCSVSGYEDISLAVIGTS